MPTNDSHHRARHAHERSPLASAVILLGFYVAMYLAIAAVLQVLDPQRDDAMVTDDPPAPVAATSAPDCRPNAPYDFRCPSD